MADASVKDMYHGIADQQHRAGADRAVAHTLITKPTMDLSQPALDLASYIGAGDPACQGSGSAIARRST